MKKFVFDGKELYNLDHVYNIYKEYYNESYKIHYNYHGGSFTTAYDTMEERDKAFDEVIKIIKQKGGIMDSIKEYFKKNQDVFITIAIIVLLDNFLFEGKFREKIIVMVEKLISKTEKKLEGE